MNLMKVSKYFLILLLAIVVLSAAYTGAVWSFASWYDGINMETPYSVSHYEKKLKEISEKFADEPLDVTAFSLSEDECEGFLKLALQTDASLAAAVAGVDLTIQQNFIVIKSNLQKGTIKKGIEITIEPFVEEKERELSFKVSRIRLGSYPIPSAPLIYILEKTIDSNLPLKIEDGHIKLNINDLPVALKYVRIEAKQVIAGLSMAINLTDISNADNALIQEVFVKADTLNDGVSSTQIKEYINEMKNKDMIIPEDIEKAKAIYNSLSTDDKEALHRNLEEFLRDPAVNKALKDLGLL